jgi:hypothetical protein
MARHRIGTKVRVKNFPRSTDPNNGFDFNGLVGTIEMVSPGAVGFGMGNSSVYSYVVVFKDLNIPRRTLDKTTGRLVTSSVKSDARNTFDDCYLEPVV